MRRILAAIAIAAGVATPARAHAQHNDDLSKADSLFNAAKALLDAGQDADACAKFAESKRLAPGLGVTLYLADCYERIGRTASAWTEFRSAEGLARQRNDRRADVAKGRAQTLEPNLNRLTITVAPTIPQAGLQILRDGVAITSDEWGLAVPVDPGDHAIVVLAPGHPQRTFPAHVGPENRTAIVRIDRLDDNPAPIPAPEPAPVAGPAPAATPEPPSAPLSASPIPGPAPPAGDGTQPSSDGARRWLGLGVAGAGVIGVGIGAAFGLVAKSKLNQSNDGPCDSRDRCTSSGLSLRQDASHAATISDVSFVVGGVAIAAGIAVYVTAPRGAPSTGLVIAPAPTAGGFGAIARASF